MLTEDDGENHTEKHHDRLHDIRPDDGFHSTLNSPVKLRSAQHKTYDTGVKRADDSTRADREPDM